MSIHGEELLSDILDSWNKPVVYVDTDHIIRYMNEPAKKNYAKWGDILGKSIFHCHNDRSCRIIESSLELLRQGVDEILITDNEKHRVYMRGVRNRDGRLTGYFERYDPPKGK
jgi:DUF438 domain-containing protein